MTALRTPARQVALNRIPDALRDVWRACSSNEPGGNVSRALTINFIGIARAVDELELRAAVDKMHRRQPCRAFLILAQDGVQTMHAEVSGGARSHGQTREIVLEQIELRVPPAWFGNVPGLVRPLLVNDIPTHLYWATTWPQLPRHFDALLELSDHAVVDSGLFTVPAAELDALRVRQEAGRKLTDLTWLRLRPWRRALAEALERFPWQPAAPTSVTLRHAANTAAQASALLLGRWLEKRLLAAVFLEESGPGEQNQPDSVELRHGSTTVVATSNGRGQIQVKVETTEVCWLPFMVAASRGSAGDLLAAAIDMA
ncbi:MAG: glucose-6-phosphate dehydrogenase assembly protein OpcA [Planctomycetes bacterium]|nr:glucose-6-phosphate dehydrogenase assembly protein OpcA [Planctomycetota bacterium]